MPDCHSVSDIANLLVAIVALLVALISGVYTWRAFALQRQSSSAAGLDFLYVKRREGTRELVQTDTGPQAKIGSKPFYVSAILSRGPGVRYGAQGAVWGKGRLQVLTPQVQVWGPDHPGVEFELKRTADGKWEDVYCGVVWETPRMFWKGFTVDGYRTKVGSPAEKVQDFHAERWNARKQRWVPLKGSQDITDRDPLKDAADKGKSFNGQLGDRYPDSDAMDTLTTIFNRPGSSQ